MSGSGWRPSESLAGLPPQFSIRTDAEKWQGALKETRANMREQGEVMTAALSNNRALWETNKRLRQERVDLIATCARLEHERNEALNTLNAIPADVKDRILLQQENEQLLEANRVLKHELSATMIPEMDTDTRRAERKRLVEQAEELAATGLVPTSQEIAARDHARDQSRPFSFDPAGIVPGLDRAKG